MKTLPSARGSLGGTAAHKAPARQRRACIPPFPRFPKPVGFPLGLRGAGRGAGRRRLRSEGVAGCLMSWRPAAAEGPFVGSGAPAAPGGCRARPAPLTLPNLVGFAFFLLSAFILFFFSFIFFPLFPSSLSRQKSWEGGKMAGVNSPGEEVRGPWIFRLSGSPL